MSVVVAHQASTIGQGALREAAREASLRGAPLAVVHVAEGVDLEAVEAHKSRVEGQISEVLSEIGLSDVPWTLQITTGEDVGEAVLDVVATLEAELLVIGARRRTPVGKLFLGSATQNIILHADVPVLVVKAPAA